MVRQSLFSFPLSVASTQDSIPPWPEYEQDQSDGFLPLAFIQGHESLEDLRVLTIEGDWEKHEWQGDSLFLSSISP